MTDKEILQMKLENAQLRHGNISLQGMILSRDLREMETLIGDLQAQLDASEEVSDEPV